MWTLREEQRQQSSVNIPLDSKNIITIKMHHGGEFEENYSRYVDGKVSYFDCNASIALTMSAMHSMALSLGYDGHFVFLFSRSGGCDSCIDLEYLIIDADVRNLRAFVDNERVVGVFIEHFTPKSDLECHVGSSHEVEVGYDAYDDRKNVNKPEVEKNVEVGSMFGASNMFEIDSQSDCEGSDEESDGNDSVYTDGFEESDFELDDILFDENIDKEVEWEGCEDLKVRESSLGTNFQQCLVSKKKLKAPKTYGGLKCSIYKGDAGDSDFEFETGMCFNNATDFRYAMRTYSTKKGRSLKFSINCSSKVQVTCKCGWVVYASYISKNVRTFQIKTISKEQHSCYREPSAKHCTSTYLAEKYKHYFIHNPLWPIESMQEIMQRENFTELSVWKLYRTRKKAMLLNNGGEFEQYSLLRDYCEEIKRTQPDTTLIVKCKYDLGSMITTFKRLYMCLGALKNGFKAGCRPLIGLDGTHMKTRRGGVLLTAVGIDGNNGMFPFAYALVKKESRKTWEWFIELLVEDLGIQNSFCYTVVSDKQKGLIKAVEKFLPNAEHRFCLRHLYNNFKLKHKGLPLKDLLWEAGTACRVVDFKDAMEKLKAMDRDAYEWLRERPPQNWSRSHFSTWPKSDMLLNNLCESFNKFILKARDKHIITMLETIRVQLMRRIPSQRDKVLRHIGDVCPNVQRIIENNKKRAHEYCIIWNGKDKYEVKGYRGDVRVVDLNDRTCSCRRWDLTGIPCVHAIVCIFHKNQHVEDYVEHWFKKSTYLKAYQFMINPVRGKEEWTHSEHSVPILPWTIPPPKVGRPKSTSRRKEADEKIVEKEGKVKLRRHGNGTKYTCSNCGKLGHNKNGCKEGKIKKEDVPRATQESEQS